MATYGKPTKANGGRRDTPAPAVRGRTIAPGVHTVSVVVRDAEPIGTALMATLGVMYPTLSPASRGGGPSGGGVTGLSGSGTNRDGRRGGMVQQWRGLHAPIANPRGRKVGAQAGPSSQPAFPSTGTTASPTLLNSLSGMGLPSVLRTPVVS